MVPMHAIGLALALPGKLAAALTKTSRHIDIALMGATRNNQSNIRASIPGGQTYSEVMSQTAAEDAGGPRRTSRRWRFWRRGV